MLQAKYPLFGIASHCNITLLAIIFYQLKYEEAMKIRNKYIHYIYNIELHIILFMLSLFDLHLVRYKTDLNSNVDKDVIERNSRNGRYIKPGIKNKVR